MERSYILSVSCPDRVGVTAALSGFIAEHCGWITESSQHSDPEAGYFFVRIAMKAASLPFDTEGFAQRFQRIADEFQMTWRISDTGVKNRVVVMVSKFDHCLNDLLYRWRNQDFAFDIPCIISNHEDLRDYVEWHGIPYHHVPVTKDNKQQAYDEIERLFSDYQGDTMVLARYMQIIPEEMCARYPGQIINIHHSFLPSFVGAKPYHQAYQRGVKLIGATCHYVTAELDAGPIIEQDVIRVDHSYSIEDMVSLGKDVEKSVLSRGLRYHVEDRILLHENRTVILD